MNFSANLEWGCTDFTLLGIEFSTNMSDIMEQNYGKALEKIKKLEQLWNNRYLTPICKITVILTITYRSIDKYSTLETSGITKLNLKYKINSGEKY